MCNSNETLRLVVTLVTLLSIFGAAEAEEPQKPAAKSSEIAQAEWTPLKDGWKGIQFGGEGPVTIDKDSVKLGYGDPLTGVQWTAEVPRENFEIEFEGRRIEGFDFFCGLTFPIGSEHASLILGGWGGGVVGLSSINEEDASSNETSQYKQFDNGTWYKIRVRVTDEQVTAWIDDKKFVDVPREDRKFSVRYEMDPTLPLGISAYQCSAEFKNLRIRSLKSDSPASDSPAILGD